ncbi:MAG: LysR family transcriptional regulator [Pseudomonadota bacterium]
MNWSSIAFDWNQARAFLATAEEGSLSAAARALGQTQPTLGRQVSALEEALGVTLFERAGRAMRLTEAGRGLIPHMREMAEAATQVSLKASGQAQAAEGKVSITATNAMAAFHLPKVLKKIRATAPGIELEIITSNDVRDLTQREADIAIRHGRPDQPELIAKLLGETSAHLYASTEFLDTYGRPKSPEDLAGFQFIGFDTPDLLIAPLREIGVTLSRDNFKITTANGLAMAEYIKCGLGIGVLVKEDAATLAGMEQVLPMLPPFEVPVWLATHRELHTSRRYRIVYDIIAEEIQSYFKAIVPA